MGKKTTRRAHALLYEDVDTCMACPYATPIYRNFNFGTDYIFYCRRLLRIVPSVCLEWQNIAKYPPIPEDCTLPTIDEKTK